MQSSLRSKLQGPAGNILGGATLLAIAAAVLLNNDTWTKEPGAEYDTKCDYLLGDGIKDADWFVGSADVKNTGGGHIDVRLVASWELLGDAPVEETQNVSVPEGETRRVRFKVLAKGNQISAHQSADGECRIRGRIVK